MRVLIDLFLPTFPFLTLFSGFLLPIPQKASTPQNKNYDTKTPTPETAATVPPIDEDHDTEDATAFTTENIDDDKEDTDNNDDNHNDNDNNK